MARAIHELLVPFRLDQRADGTRPASLVAGRRGQRVRATILHPTDYSAPSRQAFELACRIARVCGGRLLVMHVAGPVRRPSLGMAAPPPLPRGYRAAWESRLRLMRPHDPAVPVEHRLEEGDVAAAILRVAREAQSDLIVMACREWTGLGRLLNKSVAEAVGRSASCPVITVTVPREGFLKEG